MSDYIIRGMAADKQVRFFAANTKDLVEKARRIQEISYGDRVDALHHPFGTKGCFLGSIHDLAGILHDEAEPGFYDVAA